MTISQTPRNAQGRCRTRRLGRPRAYGQAQDQAASKYEQVARARTGRAGPFSLPDEAQTCTSKLRVILGAVYSTYVERSPDGKPRAANTFVLPPDAEKDGFGWRLSNGNLLETEARLAGLFNGVEAELDLVRTGMRGPGRSIVTRKPERKNMAFRFLASLTSLLRPNSPMTADKITSA